MESHNHDESNQKALIADFGISFKLNNAADASMWRIGTQGFMAPEVYAGIDYNQSCDVFSLGCLLYWFISSKRPFWA